MKPFPPFHRVFACLLAIVASIACAHTVSAAPAAATLTLRPFRDPLPSALPRLWDVGNRQYDAFVDGTQTFSYANATVKVSYDPNPTMQWFTGTIAATGLKPNFWYQMKLAGKPVSGTRGWGSAGDDWANEQIGYAGRWWGDEADRQWNIDDDSEYRADYADVTDPAQRQTVYGYIYMSGFLTDQNGNYSGAIDGSRSCHVTWQDWQNQTENENAVALDNAHLASTSSYGYGYNFDSSTGSGDNPVPVQSPVKLWYEYQARADRIRPNTALQTDGTYKVNLPAGHYDCRFLLTEESFHNDYGGGTEGANGGFWLTVLANEDFDSTGKPDLDASNDISFTIASPDHTAPPAPIVVSPSRNGWTTALPAIAVTASDNAGGIGIAQVKIYLRRNADNAYWNGTIWGTTQTPLMATAGANNAYTLSAGLPARLDDGIYAVGAYAIDKAGNQAAVIWQFGIDGSAPTGLSVSAPARKSTVLTVPALMGRASDAGSGIARVDFGLWRASDGDWWNGRAWGGTSPVALTASRGGDGSWSRTAGLPAPGGLGATNLAPGAYRVYLRVIDRVGNTAQISSQFRVVDRRDYFLVSKPSALP